MDNYGALKAAVTTRAIRPDLAALAPDFIREAEGMIRRELRAITLRAQLLEANRDGAGGIYVLPDGFQEERAVYARVDGDALVKVGVGAIRRLSASAPVVQYAIHDETRIEFRGVPGTDAEMSLVYLGHPAALVADGDTNVLLQKHESLYLRGALFFLYQHTQDRELAEDQLAIFNGVLEQLNERAGRTMGGATSAGAYNLFGCGGPR